MKRETFWEVEWFGEPPLDENGDSDWDATPCYSKNFTTKAAAIRFAENTAAKKDSCGEARITEWWKKPWPYCVAGWEQEYIGETEFVQDERKPA